MLIYTKQNAFNGKIFIFKIHCVIRRSNSSWLLFPARGMSLNPPIRTLKVKGGKSSVAELSQCILISVNYIRSPFTTTESPSTREPPSTT